MLKSPADDRFMVIAEHPANNLASRPPPNSGTSECDGPTVADRNGRAQAPSFSDRAALVDPLADQYARASCRRSRTGTCRSLLSSPAATLTTRAPLDVVLSRTYSSFLSGIYSSLLSLVIV